VATIFSDLISKLVAMVSPGLALKPVARVYQFVPQNRQPYGLVIYTSKSL
jgi:hypothetical protein